MTRLTAEQARELAGPTVDEIVDRALEIIRQAAINRKHECNLIGDFWSQDGYSKTHRYMQAIKQLEELGYTTEFFYEEHQFVTMYTIVRW